MARKLYWGSKAFNSYFLQVWAKKSQVHSVIWFYVN